jgi:hypothetical protein
MTPDAFDELLKLLRFLPALCLRYANAMPRQEVRRIEQTGSAEWVKGAAVNTRV